MSIGTNAPPLSCSDNKERDDAPAPTLQQLTTMQVQTATVCRLSAPGKRGTRALHLSSETVLSPDQTVALLAEFSASILGTPDCPINPASDVVYVLLLRDTAGDRWKVYIPDDDCRGFSLADHTYWSPGLTSLLASYPLPASGSEE